MTLSNHDAVRRGRYTRIRPVLPDDYGWLFETAVLSPVGVTWRLHGDAPTFDAFMNGLLSRSTATFVITDHDEVLLGMAQVIDHQPLSRHAYLSSFLHPEVQHLGWPLEGVVLFLDHVFRAYDLRKVYLESIEASLDTYRSLIGPVLAEEGCLRQHRYVLGELQDCWILALYREVFEAQVDALLPGRR